MGCLNDVYFVIGEMEWVRDLEELEHDQNQSRKAVR